METISLTDWYKTIGTTIPEEISKEIGHFKVFKNEEVVAQFKTKKVMPYNTIQARPNKKTIAASPYFSK